MVQGLPFFSLESGEGSYSHSQHNSRSVRRANTSKDNSLEMQKEIEIEGTPGMYLNGEEFKQEL